MAFSIIAKHFLVKLKESGRSLGTSEKNEEETG